MSDFVTIRTKAAPLGRFTQITADKCSGDNVYSYIPESLRSVEVLDISVNGKSISNEQAFTDKPIAGDVIDLRPVPGFLDSLAISLAIQWGIWVYNSAQQAEERKKQGILERQQKQLAKGSYSLDFAAAGIPEGEALPVIYGDFRTEGAVISQFNKHHSEGDRLYTLLALSEGPVSSILPNGMSDLRINGNSGSNFNGIAVDSEVGTINQDPVERFRDTVTTTIVNTQLTQGGTWGGEANKVTLTGTVTSKRAQVKIIFYGGFYSDDERFTRRVTTFMYKYRYQVGGGGYGAWSTVYQHTALKTHDYELLIDVDFATSGVHDLEITRVNCDTSESQGVYSDSYVYSYQEYSEDDLKYPYVAVCGVRAVPQQQLTGNAPTYSVYGKWKLINQLTSATVVTAPAWGNNPADVLLDLLYSSRYGMAPYIDTRVKVTLSAVSDTFTVGEEVRGPASDYQFRGTVYYHSGTTMIIKCIQGLPYTSITGQTSGETATVDSLDEAYAVDLAAFWEWHQFCDEYVPDGTGDGSTVDANSASGQKVLNVAATTAFAAGDHVSINPDGDREETGVIDTIQAGVSITLLSNLTYTHTLAQADAVKVAEKRYTFNGAICDKEDGMKVYERLCKTSQTMPCLHGQKMRPRPYKAETPTMVITEGSIVRGSASLEQNGRVTIPNIFDIKIYDKANDYLPATITIEDPLVYTNSEWLVRGEIEVFGCTSASEATRIGNFRLKRARYCGNITRVSLGRQYLNAEVGEVFHYQHSYFGYGNRGGRVVSSTASTITLDRTITLGAGTYTITVQHADDTIETQTITSAVGTHLTLSISPATWTANPAKHDIYGLGTLGRYRIVAIRPAGMVAEITAEEDDTAYYINDLETIPTWTPSTIINPGQIPPDVTGVAGEFLITVPTESGTPRYTLSVGWTPPDSNVYSRAEIFMRHVAAQVRFAGNVQRQASTADGEYNAPRGSCVIGEYLYVANGINCRIEKINRSSLAYSAKAGTYGTGNGQYDTPVDIATDGTYLFVLDMGNSRIQVLNAAMAYQSQIGSYGTGDGEMKRPGGICCDGTSVWIADTNNDRLQKFTIGVGGALTFASKSGSTGSGDGQFNKPYGIAVSGDYLFVADSQNNRIQKLAKSDYTFSAKIGSNGTGDDQFKFPMAIEADTTLGVIWVADTWNHRLHRRSFTTLALVELTGKTDCTSGAGPNEFFCPSGISYDSTTNLICVSESLNHRVQLRDSTEDASGYPWVYKGQSTTNNYPISDGIFSGDIYEVAVCATSATGARKDPDDAPSVTVEATRRGSNPPNVTSFQGSNNGQMVTLTWSPVQISDLRYYAVHVGVSWDVMSSCVGFTTATTITASPPPFGETRTYWIKAITWTGESSTTAAQTTINGVLQIPTWPVTSSWNWGL